MKVESRFELIPAKTVEVFVYVADDGKEFSSKYDCEQYEKELKIKEIKELEIPKLSVDYLTLTKMFYITNKKDADLILRHYFDQVSNDFSFYKGPGYYVRLVDYTNEYMYKYEEYIMPLKDYLEILQKATQPLFDLLEKQIK